MSARTFRIQIKNWSGSSWTAFSGYLDMQHGRLTSYGVAGGQPANPGVTPGVAAYDQNNGWVDHNMSWWFFESDGALTG